MKRRRALRHSSSSHGPSQDRWLVSYADFITLLFAVFVVLFAFASHSREPIGTVSSAIHLGFNSLGFAPKPGQVKLPRPSAAIPFSAAVTYRPQLAEIEKQLDDIFGDAISHQEIELQETPEGLVISLRESGFFNSGEAALLPGATETLQKAAVVLARYGVEVRVEGHSDDQPIHNATYDSNWQLSTARAMSVLSVFTDDSDFPAEKISLAAYGPYRPVADNATPEGRRMNRRVNLVVTPPRS